MINEKKLFIFLILFISCQFFLFSAGSNGERKPDPGEMRLNIINQTNTEIKVYLNRRDASVSIKVNENYQTETLLMDFDNTYPFFLGIEFPDYITQYYIFKREIPPESMERLFYVIVNDRSAYFFPDNHYHLIGHLLNIKENLSGENLSDANRLGSDEWMNYRWPRARYNLLELLIINDTTIRRNVFLNNGTGELYYELDPGEARLVKIMEPLFLQGNRFNNIESTYYRLETEYFSATDGTNYRSLIHRRPIRLEDELQIIRMFGTDGNITVQTR